ncbi:hypothetical protein SAMN05216413_0935 [Ruminococcaceae bacterium KH2T8]|jgi:hypothetical protein|nr:hypothetical protein SAMN05216413_0935 [Ruminococcaceae bacterium KH2T8]
MWTGILILSFVLMLIFIIGSSVKRSASRKIERERYAKMTGVADGKVLERRMVKKNIRTTREGEDYDLKCMIRYEFEADDGRVYTNEGEGSGAIWNKDSQKIRYNPEDPKDNCTEYVYKNKMGISDVIGGISFLLIMAGIVLVICLLFKSRL